ncbi:class I SAM-dependent methyltransferase [candidate division KSB1 bacterium]|nr:class I SAM-dependent methyltransferase [candidate division KSB1 bacterium]MBL7094985.1 class I SAM-dependent methyltransferase [candidate division KSB1 bacterium]
MKRKHHHIITIFIIVLTFPFLVLPTFSQELKENSKLDKQVEKFLESHKHQWRDMNVPVSDGKLLYNIIIKNKYTKALEIGTSTGHSAIWIAWALSKTGGKLTTIEIDERRYKEALTNFKKAGLAEYIDARLADAHKLVKELKGPFDFVFSDADKYWYKQYFLDACPKLEIGGCFTAHNIRERGKWSRGGTGEFYNHIKNLSNYKTTLDLSGAGLSISYKKSDK